MAEYFGGFKAGYKVVPARNVSQNPGGIEQRFRVRRFFSGKKINSPKFMSCQRVAATERGFRQRGDPSRRNGSTPQNRHDVGSKPSSVRPLLSLHEEVSFRRQKVDRFRCKREKHTDSILHSEVVNGIQQDSRR